MNSLNRCITLAGLVASASAFTINSPSASSYWVQFTSNSIAWTTGGNDPPTVTLQIVNSNASLLNGAFSIAEYVPASKQSYTVTNVTLVVADGYMVQMVNPANGTDVYAHSAPFSVKPNGTALAPGTGPGGVPMTNMPGMSGDMSNMPGMNGTNSTSGRTGSTPGFNNNPNNTASANARPNAGSQVAPASFTLLPVLALVSALVL